MVESISPMLVLFGKEERNTSETTSDGKKWLPLIRSMAVFSLYAHMEWLSDLQIWQKQRLESIVTSLATVSTLTITDSSNLLDKASIKTHILVYYVLMKCIKFSLATVENN